MVSYLTFALLTVFSRLIFHVFLSQYISNSLFVVYILLQILLMYRECLVETGFGDHEFT